MGEGTTNPEEVVSVHWFRRGLRVHDNAALLEACVNCDHLIPLYVLDTTNTRTSARKKEFLLASLGILIKPYVSDITQDFSLLEETHALLCPRSSRSGEHQKLLLRRLQNPTTKLGIL